MVTSTLVCVVSVKSRNLVPVKVLKHCKRKFSVSKTSNPDEGSGRLGISVEPGAGGCATGLMGFRRAVMAWTLETGIGKHMNQVLHVEEGLLVLPMKSAC